MDEDSITSFLDSVIKDELERKIIRMISEGVSQDKILDALLESMNEGRT